MNPIPARTSTVLVLIAVAMLAFAGSATAATPKVVAGARHSCALSDSGTISCWGTNTKGGLGDGTTTTRTSAVPVLGMPSAIDVAVGDGSTCALAADATVWCWGDNQAGSLGIGSTDAANHVAPTKVPSLAGLSVTQLSGGNSNYCALISDGTVRCWGANGYGEIGNAGAGSPQTTPIAVTGLSGVAKVAAGYAHSCAVLIDTTARCWGYNTNGMLGNGMTGSGGPTVVTVLNLLGASDITASGYYSCAISFQVGKCWGGAGNIGTADGSGSSSPIAPPGLTGAVALGGSNTNGCAVVALQGTKCWGYRIGDGTPSNKNAPTDVPTLASAVSLSQNGYGAQVCALMRGGSVACWGDNTFGQIGNGSMSVAPELTPVAAIGVDAVTRQYPAGAVSFTRTGKTKLDKKKKTYTVAAALTIGVPQLISPAESCNGAVAVSVKYSYAKYKRIKGKRKRVTVKKTAKSSPTLAAAGNNCVAAASIKLPVKYLNGKRVAIGASWPGNSGIEPVSAKISKFGLPKVKAKKTK